MAGAEVPCTSMPIFAPVILTCEIDGLESMISMPDGERRFEIALDPDAFDSARIQFARNQRRASIGRDQSDGAGKLCAQR